ncbi:MAG: CBS domain-containing protein [Rhodopirellula sp.]|nr:CBS domain-containing protein [Rhodopirellula sp.]
MQVTVRDLMTSQPLTIGEQVSVEAATRKLLERAASELYVVDENGRLLGTVSDFALLKARMISADANEPVARCMSRNMLLLKPDMRLDEVAGFFRESCYPRLAVVDGGRIIGQLSRRDVLRAIVVIEEIAVASESDCAECSLPQNSFQAATGSRMHRLEQPAETVPPEPAGLRSAHDVGSGKSGQHPGTLTAR